MHVFVVVVVENSLVFKISSFLCLFQVVTRRFSNILSTSRISHTVESTYPPRKISTVTVMGSQKSAYLNNSMKDNTFTVGLFPNDDSNFVTVYTAVQSDQSLHGI